MGPGHGTEAPDKVGGRAFVRAQAIRRADQEARLAHAAVAPAFDQSGKGVRRLIFSQHWQLPDWREKIPRERRSQGLFFL